MLYRLGARLTPGCAWVVLAWFQCSKLNCDEPLSSFAFNFNLRLYTKKGFKAWYPLNVVTGGSTANTLVKVGTGGYPLLRHAMNAEISSLELNGTL
jgi:hypothetical protein